MTRVRVARAEDFWGHPAAIATLIDRDRCEPYERRLVEEAISIAQMTGAVERIGVVGIGAGRELTTVRSAAPDAEIVGWDSSRPMVDACRRRIESLGLARCRVDHRPIEAVESALRFDVIVGLNAALCYPQPDSARRAAFESMRRLLRMGGCVAMVVQQRNGRPDWALWFAARHLAQRLGIGSLPSEHLSCLGDLAVPVHHYSRSELFRGLEDAGFGVIALVSLRRWQGTAPLRSPNPLVAFATARSHLVE